MATIGSMTNRRWPWADISAGDRPALTCAFQCGELSGHRRDLEDLARLDLVGVAQLITVRVEDLLVRIRVAELFFGDLAERIASLDSVGLRRGLTAGRRRL